ncbi:hypothetical protein D7V97_00105 [Corallococcus sp. CA053C]|nr:hypothetical protein D7V97_00105 [Corallococcus sp. CA053C]
MCREAHAPSFSRPRVPDDNAFSEALFRTLKYRPSFPQRAFASTQDAHVILSVGVATRATGRPRAPCASTPHRKYRS